MAEASDIKPALTAEEWATKSVGVENSWCDDVGAYLSEEGHLAFGCAHAGYEIQPESFAGLAALLLHGQPFGFTHEDVRMLREVAEGIAGYATSVTEPADAEPLFALADRIAALVPPESAP